MSFAAKMSRKQTVAGWVRRMKRRACVFFSEVGEIIACLYAFGNDAVIQWNCDVIGKREGEREGNKALDCCSWECPSYTFISRTLTSPLQGLCGESKWAWVVEIRKRKKKASRLLPLLSCLWVSLLLSVSTFGPGTHSSSLVLLPPSKRILTWMD